MDCPVRTQLPWAIQSTPGGDGNDWFDANNNLIWGKTTGPVVTNRPSATLEFYYKQTVSQSISIQTIATEA